MGGPSSRRHQHVFQRGEAQEKVVQVPRYHSAIIESINTGYLLLPVRMPNLEPNLAHSPTDTLPSLSISAPYSATDLRSSAVSRLPVMRMANSSKALLSAGSNLSRKFILDPPSLRRCWLRYRYLDIVLDGDVGASNGRSYRELLRSKAVSFADLIFQNFERSNIHLR